MRLHKNSFIRCASWVAISAAAFGGSACKSDIKDVAASIKDSDAGAAAEGLAKQCGLSCPKDGILEGNASISGVTSVDAFFSAVIGYQHTADSVSGEIETQLDAIKPDFGIAADADLNTSLDAQIKTYCSGGLTVVNEPAHCSVDVKSVVKAEANCDASVDPGKAMVECEGTCEGMASATASCDSSASLTCTTTAPSVTCAGECQGACNLKLSAAGSCAGTCEGTCTGACSAYAQDSSGDFVCKGTCTGMCKGSCTSELAVAGKCSGSCEGECTIKDSMTSCSGSAKASCTAKAGAMVMCGGRCNGQCHPPKAKAECEASAEVHSKLYVQCTPPHVAISYKLATLTGAKLTEQARFVVALKKLEGRLPALLAATEHAKSVGSAGELLVTSSNGAVKDSFKAAVKGKLSVQQTIGLGCAIGELDAVSDAVSTSSDRLNKDLSTCGALMSTLGTKS